MPGAVPTPRSLDDLTAEHPLLLHGDCLELMKTLPDQSVDLFVCDLPYGETNCAWDTRIDLAEFWRQFRRIRKSKRVACIHFCSTGFGYTLIKSWERGFKMDMVWKKRNKTGGLQSRFRPMRNHEMVYFFYEQAPKYNRDQYHKRIKSVADVTAKGESAEPTIYGTTKADPGWWAHNGFKGNENPASVLEEQDVQRRIGTKGGASEKEHIYTPEQIRAYREQVGAFDTPTPASVLEDNALDCFDFCEGDAPYSVFESGKCFVGKRNHKTEKPQDILEFFLKYWSDPDDVIFDPTMGSGSTGVACKRMGRRFIGCELDDGYYEVCVKRIGETARTPPVAAPHSAVSLGLA